MTDQPHGLARGLTNHGAADFSLYRRRSGTEPEEATSRE
jgi:hypothetical protein